MRKKILTLLLAFCVVFVFSTSAALAITITVRINSQNHSVSIDGSKTVGDLKVQIVSDCDVDVDTLYFNGSEISDSDTLNDLGVTDGSVISDSSSGGSSPAPAPVTTTKVAKIGSNEYETLAAAISATSTAQEAANKAIEVIANTSVSSDLTIPVGVTVTINNGKTLSFSDNAKLTVEGKLEVANGGTLDLTASTLTGSGNVTTEANRPLKISKNAELIVNGTLISKNQFNDICQYGTLTINSGATVKINSAVTYIGSTGMIALSEGAKIVQTPRVEDSFEGGYKYTLTGKATVGSLDNTNPLGTMYVTGKDQFIVTNGATLEINKMAMADGATTGEAPTVEQHIIVNNGGKLLVLAGGTLDLSINNGATTYTSSAKPLAERLLSIEAGGKFEVKGTVNSNNSFNDIAQLGTMTIYDSAAYKTGGVTYIGTGGAVTLGTGATVVSVPRNAENYAEGYFYTLTGTATSNLFQIMGNDSFIIPEGSTMYVTSLTLSGYKADQLDVADGGKVLKTPEANDVTFNISTPDGGEKWSVDSGTFFFNPCRYYYSNTQRPASFVASGYTANLNSDGTYTVAKRVSHSSGSSSTQSELEKAKNEAKAEVKTEAEAQKYDEAEAAEVAEIKAQAEKDIAAAKTVEEVKKIEAEAEAKIEAIPTAEEKAEIAAVKGVDKQVFKAKSKKAKLNGKNAIKVTWNLPKGLVVDGYEVYRSTERYSGFGTEPYFTTTKTSYINNKDLKSGKTYYYKVKGYKMINGEKIYTGWSTKAYRTI